MAPEEPANADCGQADRADIQHRREQERDVKGASKTIAQLALEMSHFHRLADLIKVLKDLAMRRKSYQDEVKESSKRKTTAASYAPKKQRTTGGPTPAGSSTPTLLPTAHGGKTIGSDTRGGTSQPPGTPFPWPFTHSPGPGGTPAAPPQSSSSLGPAPPARPEDQMIRMQYPRKGSRRRPPQFRVHFAMKSSLSSPLFPRNGSYQNWPDPLFLLAGQLVHVTWSCSFIIGWWEVENLYIILELGRSPFCTVKRETSWWILRQLAEDIHQPQQDTPAHNELRAPM